MVVPSQRHKEKKDEKRVRTRNTSCNTKREKKKNARLTESVKNSVIKEDTRFLKKRVNGICLCLFPVRRISSEEKSSKAKREVKKVDTHRGSKVKIGV